MGEKESETELRRLGEREADGRMDRLERKRKRLGEGREGVGWL